MPRSAIITMAVLLLIAPALVRAQDDDIPLGDLARAARKAKQIDEQKVIDNDNLNVMMDQAESERLNGKPVFSIDPSGNAFRMTSPDGTCSLSFDAKATALISTPFVTSEIPQDELLKLQGPATIHDGVLEVSLHNGTGWDVKEIVVGITVVQNPGMLDLKPARLLEPVNDSATQKLPDMTMLYHLKATSPPDAYTVFRADLGGDLDPSKEWHWALIGGRGIPPAAPGSVEEPAPAMNMTGGASLPDISLSETKTALPIAPTAATNSPLNSPNPPMNSTAPPSHGAPALPSTQH